MKPLFSVLIEATPWRTCRSLTCPNHRPEFNLQFDGTFLEQLLLDRNPELGQLRRRYSTLAGCSTQECGLFDLQRSRKAVAISIATSVPAIEVVSHAGAYHGEILILLQHEPLVTCNEMRIVGTEVVK